MKILLINKYWRLAGGVEVHAFQVKNWLESRGHTVIPFAMSEPETIPNEYSAYFPSEVDLRGGGDLLGTLRGLERATISRETKARLRDLISKEKPDSAYVLHVYHQLGMRILNILEDSQIPTVLSLHDYKIACPNYRLYSEPNGKICTKCLDSKLGFAYQPIVERCWSNSRSAGVALSVEALTVRIRRSYKRPAVITLLNSLQKRSAEHAGVDPDRLMQVPHPVTLKADRPQTNRSKFLYVGRLVPEKGVDVLIRASAASSQSVLIVGSGRSEPTLRELARELSAPVEFLPQVPHDKVISLMSASRALIVPSVWHEVSPLVVYEAIELDVPVIASRVGGMVDQLSDGRGVLVEPGDVDGLARSLSAAAEDNGLALSQMSRNAREYAREHWSPEKWTQNMVEAFRRAGAVV